VILRRDGRLWSGVLKQISNLDGAQILLSGRRQLHTASAAVGFGPDFESRLCALALVRAFGSAAAFVPKAFSPKRLACASILPS
jgi:hypothetical protein